MPPVADAIGLGVTAICANGAVVIDTRDFREISLSPIDMSLASEAVSIIQHLVPDAVFAAESPKGLRAGPGYEAARSVGRRTEGLAPTKRTVRTTGSIEEMIACGDIFKLAVVSRALAPDRLLDLARAGVGHLVSVTRSALGQALIELGPRGVDKASALAAHAATLDVSSSEVIAFGDMPNDVEMLRWSSRGYAMGGAHPEAVAAARYIAPEADVDGVAQVIEQMLATRRRTA